MPFTRTTFLGASIRGFNTAIGWNGQQSTLTVQLVVDPLNGDVFNPPPVGTPIYFQVGYFYFFGLLQKWEKKNDKDGLPTYEAVCVDPKEILDGAQVILGGYSGTTTGIPNLYNAFGFWESTGFGNSYTNESGMPWFRAMSALTTMANTFGGTPFGGPLNFRGYTYSLDLSRLPVPPSYYRVGNVSASVLELIQQICEDAQCDFTVELFGYQIRIRTVSRFAQPPLGTINAITSTNWGGTVVRSNSGLECRNELTTAFLVGGDVNTLYETQGIVQFWGYDLAGSPLTGTDTYFWYPRMVLNPPAPAYAVDAKKRFPVPVISATRPADWDAYRWPDPAPTGPGTQNGYIWARKSLRITAATNATPIVVTTAEPHLFTTGTKVTVAGCLGNTAANGAAWVITYRTATSFSLDTSAGNGNYTGSGTVIWDTVGAGIPAGVVNIGRFTWSNQRQGGELLQGESMTLNATAVAGILGSTTYDCSTFEMRCAQANMESWSSYMHAVRPDMAQRIGLTSRVRNMHPVEGVVLPRDAFNDDAAAVQRRQLMAVQGDLAQKEVAMWQFVKSRADEFMGKKFLVGLPFILQAQDPETLHLKSSYKVTDAGYLPEGATPLGLTSLNEDTFKTQDGRFKAFVKFDNLVGADFEKISAQGTVVENNVLFMDVQVQPNIVFAPAPSAVVTLSGPLLDKVDSGVTGDMSIIAAILQMNPPQAQQVLQAGQQGTVGVRCSPRTRNPAAIAVPLQSNIMTYGPWWAVGAPGKVKFEHDQGLTPWNYGSYTNMANAGLARVGTIISTMQVSEAGTIELAGAPMRPMGGMFSLGDVLSANGPNMTNMDVNYNTNGVTTSFHFKTYTPRFGVFTKGYTERLKKLGQTAQELRRAMRLSFKEQQEVQTAQGEAARTNRRFLEGAPPAVLRESPSELFVARLFHDPNGGATRVGVAVTTTKEGLEFVNAATDGIRDAKADEAYQSTAAMDLAGLFRPFSTRHNAKFMSHYQDPTLHCSVDRYSLDPWKDYNDIEAFLWGEEYEGLHAYRRGVRRDARAVGLRAPLVMSGWGYDTDGRPTPRLEGVIVGISGGCPYVVYSPGHGLASGYKLFISESSNTTINDREWPVTVIDADYFELTGSCVSPDDSSSSYSGSESWSSNSSSSSVSASSDSSLSSSSTYSSSSTSSSSSSASSDSDSSASSMSDASSGSTGSSESSSSVLNTSESSYTQSSSSSWSTSSDSSSTSLSSSSDSSFSSVSNASSDSTESQSSLSESSLSKETTSLGIWVALDWEPGTLYHSEKWKTGPYDAMWDARRGVWTSHDIVKGVASSAIPGDMGGAANVVVWHNHDEATSWTMQCWNWMEEDIPSGARVYCMYNVVDNRWYAFSSSVPEEDTSSSSSQSSQSNSSESSSTLSSISSSTESSASSPSGCGDCYALPDCWAVTFDGLVNRNCQGDSSSSNVYFEPGSEVPNGCGQFNDTFVMERTAFCQWDSNPIWTGCGADPRQVRLEYGVDPDGISPDIGWYLWIPGSSVLSEVVYFMEEDLWDCTGVNMMVQLRTAPPLDVDCKPWPLTVIVSAVSCFDLDSSSSSSYSSSSSSSSYTQTSSSSPSSSSSDSTSASSTSMSSSTQSSGSESSVSESSSNSTSSASSVSSMSESSASESTASSDSTSSGSSSSSSSSQSSQSESSASESSNSESTASSHSTDSSSTASSTSSASTVVSNSSWSSTSSSLANSESSQSVSGEGCILYGPPATVSNGWLRLQKYGVSVVDGELVCVNSGFDEIYVCCNNGEDNSSSSSHSISSPSSLTSGSSQSRSGGHDFDNPHSIRGNIQLAFVPSEANEAKKVFIGIVPMANVEFDDDESSGV